MNTSSASHYGHAGLIANIEAALAANYPADHWLTPSELAPLDQFHTRGLEATADLARTAGITADMRVLDIGAGLGGPARFLAATCGCTVIGIDSSPSYVEAAQLLTARSRPGSNVTFQQADALDLPFEDGTFDAVWMQHVAMNISDRANLYQEARRVLRARGRFVTYDVIRGSGPISYPVPWSLSETTSFLLSEDETREALSATGFRPLTWRVETEVANAWFATVPHAPPKPGSLNLGMAIGGPGFGSAVANLRRNLASGSLGILVAVMAGP